MTSNRPFEEWCDEFEEWRSDILADAARKIVAGYRAANPVPKPEVSVDDIFEAMMNIRESARRGCWRARGAVLTQRQFDALKRLTTHVDPYMQPMTPADRVAGLPVLVKGAGDLPPDGWADLRPLDGPPSGPKWVCGSCGRRNMGPFNTCWYCYGPRPEPRPGESDG